MNKIKQVKGKDLLNFYINLFEDTKNGYGFFGYPHTFSCIQYKELWLPLPFLKIIDSYPMQKAMGKIQTSQCYKNHYRMDVSRLDHMVFAESIGVDLLVNLEENGFIIDNETKIAFLVFLLTHDIGHGPFSHPFEQMVDGYKGMHEDIGRRALEEIPEVRDVLENIYPGLTDRVVNFKKYDKYGLYALLEGIFDLDRAAFLIMDTYLMEGEEKEEASREIVRSVYKIFDSIVLKDGKVYIKEEAFEAVDNFIRIRTENYAGVYQSPWRVLSDNVLKRLGERIIKYSKTDEYRRKLSEMPESIGKEIMTFISFIEEMKTKKVDIDLNTYYSFEDRHFDRIFLFLLLFDNPEINKDCFVMLASNEMNAKYYKIERNVEPTGNEEFYVNNSVKVYKSTPEENITFIKDDGSTIDYKDCPGKFTEKFIMSETLSFTYREHIEMSNEDNVRNSLIDELNELLLKDKYKIMCLDPRPGYESDKIVIDVLNDYVSFIEKGYTLSDYALIKGISEHTVLTYLLMYSNNDRIYELCLILLCDNLPTMKYLFKLKVDSSQEVSKKVKTN